MIKTFENYNFYSNLENKIYFKKKYSDILKTDKYILLLIHNIKDSYSSDMIILNGIEYVIISELVGESMKIASIANETIYIKKEEIKNIYDINKLIDVLDKSKIFDLYEQILYQIKVAKYYNYVYKEFTELKNFLNIDENEYLRYKNLSKFNI